MGRNPSTGQDCQTGCCVTAAALTGGLQPLDVPGGAQEEAAQVEEEEEEGQHRDQDPGDDRHRHGDHTQDLQEHLQGKQQQGVLKIDGKGEKKRNGSAERDLHPDLSEVHQDPGHVGVQLADVFGEPVEDSSCRGRGSNRVVFVGLVLRVVRRGRGRSHLWG